MNIIICKYCQSSVSKVNISRHTKTELCVKIQNLLNKTNNEKKYLEHKISLLEEEIINYTNDIKILKQYNEEYRNIVEKAATKPNFIIDKNKKENNESSIDSSFKIDIRVDNKQLNKTKYKDVPEDVINNNIQSLKLKDNYQLEYREEDGYINITNLCKAGGKEFKSWNRLDKTKRFLDVLSLAVKIHTSSLIKVGSGHKIGNNNISETWAHPQIAINIAQWISAEFDVLVSKWVYEIMLTGKLDIKQNKTTEELDIMNKENKLLKNRIKLLESKVLQKQPRETFEENKNVVYIVTTEFKEAQGHYKIGKAQDLQKRMSVYNTSEKHEVIYNTSCKTKKNMDILEQLVHNRLESKRVEPNKEWFKSEEDGEDLIKLIEELKKVVDF